MTFRLLAASLHQDMESPADALSFVSRHSDMIGGYDWLILIVLLSTGFPTTSPSREPVTHSKSTAVFPYVRGVSEPLCHCLQQQGICIVFMSNTTFRSHLWSISWQIAGFIWLFCKQSWLHFLIFFHHCFSVFL